jgi:hypothetical protein
MLLCVIMATPMLAYLWLHIQKTLARYSVRELLRESPVKNELVLLKFTSSESETKLKWEHSREFEYDHQMYDVVETKVIGDTIYYWCWWDRRETRLNQQLSDWAGKVFHTDPQNREKHCWLLSYFKSLYFIENFYPHLLPPESWRLRYNDYCYLYDSTAIQPPAPPPKWS